MDKTDRTDRTDKTKQKKSKYVCVGNAGDASDACQIVDDYYDDYYDECCDECCDDKEMLNSKELPMPNKNTEWTIYGTNYCSFCVNAKKLLDEKNKQYVFVNVGNYSNARTVLKARTSGYQQIPVIYNKDEFIGGFSDLKKIV